MPIRRPPTHLSVAQELIRRGSIYVYTDARIPDVNVPPSFVGRDCVVLQFGYDLAVPIPDLTINEYGISGTLTFSRKPFEVFVPWVAVFGICGEDGKGQTFGDIPAGAFPPGAKAPVREPGKVIRVDFKQKRRVG